MYRCFIRIPQLAIRVQESRESHTADALVLHGQRQAVGALRQRHGVRGLVGAGGPAGGGAARERLSVELDLVVRARSHH